MPTQISYKNLPYNAFHDSFTWSLHPFLDNFIPDILEKSIAKIGILHPPVVVQTSDETYDIVCGRKRIQCAQRLGQSYIFCRILPPTAPKKTLLSFLLEDQGSGSFLSLPETAFYLKLCLEFIGKDETTEEFVGGNLPKMNKRFLLSLLEFDHVILRKIHSGLLAEKIIYDLLKLNPADRSRIVYLVELLQIGGSKQKRLITLCRDIALRENIPISSLLDQPDVKAVVEHKEMNIPQKTNRLLSLLQKRCYPQSSTAREIFHSRLHALALPGNCEINPSPSFEKDEVTLSIRFPDFKTCELIWPSLKNILQQER
jgi:ParB family transcriptional regulator, chromosome partitioning protein